MRTSRELFKHIKCVLVIVLLMSACSAFANSLAYDLASGGLDIWQITGTVCEDDSLGCNVSYTLSQDNAGKITGSGGVDCSIMGYDVYGTYTVAGTLTQKDGIANVKMNIKIALTLDDGYDTYHWRGTARVTAIINANIGTIEGTIKVLGETADYTQNLPGDMDGSAVLLMDVNVIDPNHPKKLGGSGTLELSNGDIYEYIVKGTYNPRKDLDKLTLTGVADVGEKRPCNFNLVVDGNDTLNSLKGKSLGQKLVGSGIPNAE